ncbi:MAG: alpha/beta fold hydrolase [Pararhodobacter sp.]
MTINPTPISISIVIVLGLAASLLAGCAVLDARAGNREARWASEHPPVGRMIGAPGQRVHVVEAGRPRGQAPDLVLIHGANGNLRDFTFDLVGRLERDFRILAVDRPGLGWSDTLDETGGAAGGAAGDDPRAQARALRAALADLGVNRPIVLGHSYGGAVALAWALEAPDDTAALVLLAAATHPWAGHLGLWYRLNDGPLGGIARRMVTALASDAAIERTLASVFAPAPVPTGYGAHFGPGLSLRREAQAVNVRQVNTLLGHLRAMQPRYAGLNLPIEAIHGEADTIVGLEIHAARLEAEVPGVHLTRLPGAGHMPHHSHPEEVVAAIHRAAGRAGLR